MNLVMLSSWIEERWSERTRLESSVGTAAAAMLVTALVSLMRRVLSRPRRRIRVTRVSEEWLRAFARDSSKHRRHDDWP